MALTYDDSPNGFFRQLGKVIKYINTYLTLGQTTLAADEDAIADALEAGNASNRRELVSAFQSFYASAKSLVTSLWRKQLSDLGTKRLLDKTTILDELDVPSADISTVLDALITKMTVDSESVDANTVSIGSVTAAAANVGNGTVLVTKVLDGVSRPGFNMPSHVKYNGVDSELACTDTMTLVCVADSQSDGRPEGGELFRWYGNKQYPVLSWEGEGSGEGPGVQVANNTNLITNKDFEFWSGTPAALVGWDLDLGTAGTTVVQEATAANVHRGSYALKFTGNGSHEPKISQTINRNLFKPRKRYCVSCMIYADASISTGTLFIQFEAPSGYTATVPTVEVQTVAISGTPTGGTYTLSWVGPRGGTQTTAAIAYNANSATVQAALRLLTGLESITIAESGSTPNFTHTITFTGTQGNVNQLTSDSSSLTGGTPAIAHATTTPGVEGEKITQAGSSIPAAYVPRHFFINMPATIPTGMELVVKVTGALTNTKSIWIDSLTIDEVDWHNGHGVIVRAGSTPFKKGDTFTYTVTNDAAGTFQEWARQVHGIQFPSNNAGSESIADSLAE